MWPWFTSALDRQLNRALLLGQLRRALRTLPEPPIAITKIPIVADLMGRLPVRRWVYYCVDDFAQWPGLDQATLRCMEQEVVERADTVLAASATLRDRLAGMGRDALLLTHGVDLEMWRAPGDDHQGTRAPRSPVRIPGLDRLRRPLLVFWGLIDLRIDTTFVQRLAVDLEMGTLVFAGPVTNGGDVLPRSPRVCQLPPMPHQQLPLLAREADVLIMPYADLPVTRASQPLKLKEYLATGKPAVVRDLPSTRCWADCLDLAATPEAFSQAVRQRLATGLPEAQRKARSRLESETWSEKARLFEQVLMHPDRA
jgi:glycosyltransferase involved in cell wall biosynthesis